MAAIGGAAKSGGAAKGEILLRRIAERPAAGAFGEHGKCCRPIDGGWPRGGAADDKPQPLGGVRLFAVLPDRAKADAIAAQGGAQRFRVDAKRARDLVRAERCQRGDYFGEFSRRPSPAALAIKGHRQERRRKMWCCGAGGKENGATRGVSLTLNWLIICGKTRL